MIESVDARIVLFIIVLFIATIISIMYAFIGPITILIVFGILALCCDGSSDDCEDDCE